jgi:hypothetical protein
MKQSQVKIRELKANLFRKLDKMFVLMDVKENLQRLQGQKGFYYLALKTGPDVKFHIWTIVQSAITYAYQKAYRNGYERGLVDGVFSIRQNIWRLKEMETTDKAKEILDYVLTATGQKLNAGQYNEIAEEIKFMLENN